MLHGGVSDRLRTMPSKFFRATNYYSNLRLKVRKNRLA